MKLKKNASSDKKSSSDKNVKTDRDLFIEHLVDRGIEVLTTGTDPLLADTDGDWLLDGDEILVYGWMRLNIMQELKRFLL